MRERERSQKKITSNSSEGDVARGELRHELRVVQLHVGQEGTTVHIRTLTSAKWPDGMHCGPYTCACSWVYLLIEAIYWTIEATRLPARNPSQEPRTQLL